MNIVHSKTNERIEATIDLLEDEDWEKVEESGQFTFDWRKEKDALVKKLQSEIDGEILWLIAIEDFPTELRLNIRLLESSQAHRGKDKLYLGVAGCLIAHTCQLAFENQYEGFVSLKPKTALIEHYQRAYGFQPIGNFLCLAFDQAENLIQTYLRHAATLRTNSNNYVSSIAIRS